jgi:hypothetical protein
MRGKDAGVGNVPGRITIGMGVNVGNAERSAIGDMTGTDAYAGGAVSPVIRIMTGMDANAGSVERSATGTMTGTDACAGGAAKAERIRVMIGIAANAGDAGPREIKSMTGMDVNAEDAISRAIHMNIKTGTR